MALHRGTSIGEQLPIRSRSQPLTLRVDPCRDRSELVRFMKHVVAGPDLLDHQLWVGAIGSDGYGRYAIRRDGRVRIMRTSRYALAASLEGTVTLVGVADLEESAG